MEVFPHPTLLEIPICLLTSILGNANDLLWGGMSSAVFNYVVAQVLVGPSIKLYKEIVKIEHNIFKHPNW